MSYKPLCWLVGRSVGWSVGLSVGPSLNARSTRLMAIGLVSFLPSIVSSLPSYFLVACTRLYKPLCWLVGWSVGLSVGRSVGPSLNARSTRLMAIGRVSFRSHFQELTRLKCLIVNEIEFLFTRQNFQLFPIKS